MRPGGDVLGARPRKDLETTALTPPLNSGTPTSFFIASEEMLGRVNQEQTSDVSGSTFGVESLQETIYSIAAEDGNESGGSSNNDDTKPDVRRRSTLKPFTREQDSSNEGFERALQAEINDSSLSHSSIRRTSPPSTSDSMASLSQASQLQGLSLPSSPKSTSTRSFKPSDDDSMDEAASQAIVSSEEEEYSTTEVQDSAPQLIMPSIKMPSRRPFTERGKVMGHIKILIAGDTGMIDKR